MKKITYYSLILTILSVAFSGCSNSENTSPLPVAGNESGDIFDTITTTTIFPLTVVTSVELEINDKGDTSVLHTEKFLKLKINAGYSQFLSYTGSSVEKALLASELPKGYCYAITALASKRGYADRQAVAVSYSVQKIVNHMGG
jgi:hypothetical protein